MSMDTPRVSCEWKQHHFFMSEWSVWWNCKFDTLSLWTSEDWPSDTDDRLHLLKESSGLSQKKTFSIRFTIRSELEHQWICVDIIIIGIIIKMITVSQTYQNELLSWWCNFCVSLGRHFSPQSQTCFHYIQARLIGDSWEFLCLSKVICRKSTFVRIFFCLPFCFLSHFCLTSWYETISIKLSAWARHLVQE